MHTTPLEPDNLVTVRSCGRYPRHWEKFIVLGVVQKVGYPKIIARLQNSAAAKLRERRIQNATKLNEIFFHRDEELCQSVVKEVFKCEGRGFC